jgi:multidrug efflux pump subunit AcrA (membrane-fusion protein)
MTDTPAPKRRRRLRWRGLLSALLLILVVACVAGVFVARQMFVADQAPEGAVVTQVVPVERGELLETVQINGALEPADRARLSFPAGARVAEVLVEEGDRVSAGTVLARLETRDLELGVASSQAELDQAQHALDKLLGGPSEAELASAAAGVARARANLVAAGAEVRPIDIELAQARLAAARERLAALDAGEATEEQTVAERQLSGAEEALAESQVALERTRDSASRAKTDAQQAMERGAQAVEEAQRAYSDAYWDWDYVQSTGRHPRDKVATEDGRMVNRELEPFEAEQFRRALDDATVALRNAETDLKNLSEAYDQAREEEVLQLQAAERAVAGAERDMAAARRELEQAGTRDRSSARLTARQELAEAEKGLDELVNDPTRPAAEAELRAALLEAIAADEKLRGGPDPVELARARTALEQARAELAGAEADLDEATLRAPISGTVVDITLKPGTATSADDAISIADLSRFLIRGQVTEQSVAQVRAGQAARVRVDSLPDVELEGTLDRVAELPDEDAAAAAGGQFGPSGGALGGLYPVEITVAASDERLRVGMASTAEILILSIPDALIIPLQAVEQGPDGPAVRRAAGVPGPDGVPPSELIPVELGQASGDRVQVLHGLSEGDQLLLPLMPPPDFGPQPGFGG